MTLEGEKRSVDRPIAQCSAGIMCVSLLRGMEDLVQENNLFIEDHFLKKEKCIHMSMEFIACKNRIGMLAVYGMTSCGMCLLALFNAQL